MSKLTLKPSLQEEIEIITKALLTTRWHHGKAAELLGVSRKTLYNKMKKYQEDIKSGKIILDPNDKL